MQAYRFRNVVGLNTLNDTVYLSADGARKLAADLLAVAESIANEEFSASNCCGREIAAWHDVSKVSD